MSDAVQADDGNSAADFKTVWDYVMKNGKPVEGGYKVACTRCYLDDKAAPYAGPIQLTATTPNKNKPEAPAEDGLVLLVKENEEPLSFRANIIGLYAIVLGNKEFRMHKESIFTRSMRGAYDGLLAQIAAYVGKQAPSENPAGDGSRYAPASN